MADKNEDAPPSDGDTVMEQAETNSEGVFNFDEYWLARGKTFADNTLSTLTKRMQSFIVFLNGLLGVSFVGSAGLIGYLGTANWVVYALFIVPMVIVLWARYKIGIVESSPTYKNPDLRSPLQINAAFNSIVDSKRKQLARAQGWVAAAVSAFCLFVPTGIYVHNYCEEQKALAEKEASKKSHIEIAALDNTFQVSGMLTQAETITLLLRGSKEAIDGTGEQGRKVTKDTLIMLERPVKKGNPFQYSYEYGNFGFDLKSVGIGYAEGKVHKTIEKAL